MFAKLKNWLFGKPKAPQEASVFGRVAPAPKLQATRGHWLKNNGEMPVSQATLVDVMFDNTAIERKKPAAIFDWRVDGILGPYEIAYWRVSGPSVKRKKLGE
jgi:hypothetical protein